MLSCFWPTRVRATMAASKTSTDGEKDPSDFLSSLRERFHNTGQQAPVLDLSVLESMVPSRPNISAPTLMPDIKDHLTDPFNEAVRTGIREAGREAGQAAASSDAMQQAARGVQAAGFGMLIGASCWGTAQVIRAIADSRR